MLDSSGKRSRRSPASQHPGAVGHDRVSAGSKTTLFVSNALNGGATKGVHDDRQLDGGADRARIRHRAAAEGDQPSRWSRTGSRGATTGSARARPDRASRSPPTARCTSPTRSTTASPRSHEAMTRTTPAPARRHDASPKAATSSNRSGWCSRPTATSSRRTRGDGNIVETTPGGKQLVAADRRLEDRRRVAVRARRHPGRAPACTSSTTAKTRCACCAEACDSRERLRRRWRLFT